MNALPLLTIAIPTYNRAHNLARLLEVLFLDLEGYEEKVSVVISNNGSTDNTKEVIERLVSGRRKVKVLHQPSNFGMDSNFYSCVEHVDGAFFWLLGDDDLPIPGVISSLIKLLESVNPDLTFIQSRWLLNTSLAAHDYSAESLIAYEMPRKAFACRVHIWTTFLSGMIVKKTALLEDSSALRVFNGTHISQMSWIIERIRAGTRFVYVQTPCILATSGNTGGYSAVKVFGEHFPRIVRENLSDNAELRSIARSMVLRASLIYLPELLWNLRLGRVGNFQAENVASALRPQLGKHPLTLFLLLPISLAPMPIAKLILIIGRFASRSLSMVDRLTCMLNKKFRRV